MLYLPFVEEFVVGPGQFVVVIVVVVVEVVALVASGQFETLVEGQRDFA